LACFFFIAWMMKRRKISIKKQETKLEKKEKHQAESWPLDFFWLYSQKLEKHAHKKFGKFPCRFRPQNKERGEGHSF